MSRRAVELLFVTAVLAAEVVAALLLIHASDHDQHKVLSASLAITAGVSFVFAGLIALRVRPENPTGLYLAAVGFLWFFGAIPEANSKVVYTIGAFLGNLAFIPFAALMLSFPSGRLDRTGKWIVKATAWFVVLTPPIVFLFSSDPSYGCPSNCPGSAIVVKDSALLAGSIELVATVFTVVLIGSAVVVLVRRWRAATQPARRVLLPVYAAGTLTLVVLLLSNVLDAIAPGVADVFEALFLAAFLLVPWSFLLGVLRSRFARGSVAAMMVDLEHGRPLRETIAETLGDTSLGLAFWLEHERRWVDSDGRALDLDHVPSDAITLVERDGRRVGALLHDESLASEPELVESVTAAAAFAFDNERLQAELRHQNVLLATIVDTAPSLLLTVDTEARIRKVNPATLAATGRSDDSEVLGEYFWDIFIDPDERDAMHARFRAAAPDARSLGVREHVHERARRANLDHLARGAVEGRVGRGRGDRGRRPRRHRAPPRRGGDPRLARPYRRGRGRGAPEARAEPARRRAAAAGRAVSVAAPGAVEARIRSGGRVGAPDGGRRGARSGARGAARARPRDPPGGADRPRARRGARGAGGAGAGPVELDRVGRRLPAPIEAAAYYVVSEAVTNVVKHGRASSIRVGLEAENGTFRVEVSDDGVGRR